MLKSGKNDLVLRKSYEISYALWRIATNMQERNIADTFFSNAIGLIGEAATADPNRIAEKLSGIQFLIKFAADVNVLGISTRDLLFKEIGNLKSEIEHIQAKNFGENLLADKSGKEVDLSDIFQEVELDIEDGDPEGFEETKIDIPESIGVERGNGNAKAEIRQAAILERIRQIGNCRLADIQAILPDVSDRTIRYDLESMMQRNLIERIGTGGRSVYYRIVVIGEG